MIEDRDAPTRDAHGRTTDGEPELPRGDWPSFANLAIVALVVILIVLAFVVLG